MASFNAYEPTLKQLEGGFQENPDDSGNYNGAGELVGTNYGISAKVLESYLSRSITKEDMQNLSWATAREIHKNNYWQVMKADSYNDQAVAELVVDHAINAGTGTAAKLLQQVLNNSFSKNLAVDGVVGPLTLTALNSVNQQDLFRNYATARKNDYENKNKPQFVQVWFNRISTIANKFGISIENSKNTLIVFGAVIAIAALAYMLIKNPTTHNA